MSGDQVADAQVEREVIKVLSDYFSVDHRTIKSCSRLVEDLYVDSMSVVEIAMALNEVFDMELPEAGVAGWSTVADICYLVEICRDI